MTDIETTDTSLTITRAFTAPIERVYRAFVDPDDIEAWQSIGDLEVEVHRIDPVEGGTLSMTHTMGEHRFRFEGEFLEVVEPDRLVFTLQVVEGPVTDDEHSRVTVSFEAVEDGCVVSFTEERVEPAMLDDTLATWHRMLERLGDQLGDG